MSASIEALQWFVPPVSLAHPSCVHASASAGMSTLLVVALSLITTLCLCLLRRLRAEATLAPSFFHGVPPANVPWVRYGNIILSCRCSLVLSCLLRSSQPCSFPSCFAAHSLLLPLLSLPLLFAKRPQNWLLETCRQARRHFLTRELTAH